MNKKRARDGKMKGKGRPFKAAVDTVMDDTPVASTSAAPPATHDVSLRSTKIYPIPNSVDHSASATKPKLTPLPRPRLLDYVSIGINEVTRAMESRIRRGRWELGDARAIQVASSVVESTGKDLGADGEPKKKGTRRGGKKSAISKPTPRSTIDPAAPPYQFLSTPTSTDSTPYILSPSESTPFFRLLANFQRRPTNIPNPIRTPLDIASSLTEDPTTAGTEMAAPLVDWVPILDIIFVCKPDINPPSLVAHLPTMTAAINGVFQALKSKRAGGEALSEQGESSMGLDERRVERDVLLVPLDLGAERQLATVLALRRVAAIGISTEAPGVEALLALVQKHVKPLSAPWLIPHLTQFPSTSPATTSQLIPTHVKHLRTTAPVDVKALTAAKLEKKSKGARGKEVYVAED